MRRLVSETKKEDHYGKEQVTAKVLRGKLLLFDDLYARRRSEAEETVLHCDIFLHVGEAEFGGGAIHLLNHNATDLVCRSDFQNHGRDAVLHVFRHASQHCISGVQRAYVRGERKTFEFFLQLGFAQQVA